MQLRFHTRISPSCTKNLQIDSTPPHPALQGIRKKKKKKKSIQFNSIHYVIKFSNSSITYFEPTFSIPLSTSPSS